MAFVAERGAVKVGETLNIFPSGLATRSCFDATQTEEDGPASRDYGERVSESCKASDRGGMAFSLQFLRDHQAVEIPIRIAVPWDNKTLDVGFSTFRDTLRPGQKETWSVHVKSSKGTPAVGEVLAYMYDRSLDIFRSHHPPNPLHKYQPSRLHLDRWSRSLGRASSFDVGPRVHRRMSVPMGHSPNGLLIMGGHGVGGLGFRGRGRSGGPDRFTQMMDVMPESAVTAIEFEGATIDGGETLGVPNAAPRGKAKRKQAKSVKGLAKTTASNVRTRPMSNPSSAVTLLKQPSLNLNLRWIKMARRKLPSPCPIL